MQVANLLSGFSVERLSNSPLVPFPLVFRQAAKQSLKPERNGFHGYFREDVFQRLFDSINEGDVCVDLGANVGNISILMAKRGAIVHAFEPCRETYRLLCDNTEEYSNIVTYRKAAYIRNDCMRLYYMDPSKKDYNPTRVQQLEGSSISTDKLDNAMDRYEEVDAINIIDFLRELGSIKLLKIDIEGAEYDVIDELVNANLHKKIKFITAEDHERLSPVFANKSLQLKRKLQERRVGNVNMNWT